MAARDNDSGRGSDNNDNGNGNGNGDGIRRGPPRVIAILWPAFVIAALAEFVVFALLDPAALHLPSGEPMSRPAAYTVGFFVFWALGALSSSLTLFLLREQAPQPLSASTP